MSESKESLLATYRNGPAVPGRYRTLAVGSLVGTFALVLVGGYVVAIGAGMACPGWPLCYGSVVPFFHPGAIADAPYSRLQIFAEWFHRLLAMVVGLLVVATGALAWQKRDRPVLRWSGVAAAALVVLQAGIGAWTVTSGNAPMVVVVHLGTALLLFATLLVNVLAAVGFSSAGARSVVPG